MKVAILLSGCVAFFEFFDLPRNRSLLCCLMKRRFSGNATRGTLCQDMLEWFLLELLLVLLSLSECAAAAACASADVPCGLEGVICDAAVSDITEISVPSRDLRGTLPTELGQLTAMNSSSWQTISLTGTVPSGALVVHNPAEA
ncbi:GP46-like surface antigen, putative [Bodo saltans]|uniref:GP46-like surface antigen, putative n=1 Tax=Bodo saltans TaxID=75058 RepID=A0A0S4JD74_BODSA|nr:GP46-like surface antigen, putative [Bodo saltans]|eukprot:CUG87989.1 GP46-like surface antigen, putative [Bodo saltans]